METKIIASLVKSNRSDNYVWAVSVTNEDEPKAYCKSSYKALRFAFLLKKQTGFYIEDDSMHTLLEQMAIDKARLQEQKDASVEDSKPEEKPTKKRRGRKTETAVTLE